MTEARHIRAAVEAVGAGDDDLAAEHLRLAFPHPDRESWAIQRSRELRASKAVVDHGTGWRAKVLKRPLAGKTGTTDGFRDSWFAGFSGDKVAVVWIGRDDNKPAGLSGSTGAMRVWGDIIAGSDSAPLLAQPPKDVEMLWVEPASGLLADAQCPGALQVPFLSGSGPREKAACGRKENRVRQKENPVRREENPVKNFFKRFFQ